MDLNLQPPLSQRKDFRIGILGAGAVVDECHLPAYRKAGFNPVAIASRTCSKAGKVAQRHGVSKVYDTCKQLLDDPSIEVLDIAVPPLHQPALIKAACERRTIKGILAQTPLAVGYAEAVEVVEACEQAGITLSVNQRLRYDPSVRAAKILLDQGKLGEPVFASIELRAIPEWRDWHKAFDALTLCLVSIHQIDLFRHWFGNPEGIYCSVRPNPRRKSEQMDGLNTYILEYANGLRCVGMDDVWTGPAREGCPEDLHVQWRIEGLNGLATGCFGWPRNPAQVPSLRYATKGAKDFETAAAGQDSFVGSFSSTMAQLLIALEIGAGPAISGRDNLTTMALVEAAFESARRFKSVALEEIVRVPKSTVYLKLPPKAPLGLFGQLFPKEAEPPQPMDLPLTNFTPRAQEVLALARKETERFKHMFVGTEHVLLGLVALRSGVAVNVLQKLGVNLETVRSEIEKQVGAGPGLNMNGNNPYTPRVKKVLKWAATEAKTLNHTYVGTEHILLGLLREGDGVAGRILKSLGVDLDRTRREILKELDPNFEP